MCLWEEFWVYNMLESAVTVVWRQPSGKAKVCWLPAQFPLQWRHSWGAVVEELQQTPLCWCEKLLLLPFHLVSLCPAVSSSHGLWQLPGHLAQLTEARPSSLTREKGVNLVSWTGWGNHTRWSKEGWGGTVPLKGEEPPLLGRSV